MSGIFERLRPFMRAFAVSYCAASFTSLLALAMLGAPGRLLAFMLFAHGVVSGGAFCLAASARRRAPQPGEPLGDPGPWRGGDA